MMGRVCPGCGGSGQIRFFQGVSRFLLTDEECPDCMGRGSILEPDSNPDEVDPPENGRRLEGE